MNGWTDPQTQMRSCKDVKKEVFEWINIMKVLSVSLLIQTKTKNVLMDRSMRGLMKHRWDDQKSNMISILAQNLFILLMKSSKEV